MENPNFNVRHFLVNFKRAQQLTRINESLKTQIELNETQLYEFSRELKKDLDTRLKEQSSVGIKTFLDSVPVGTGDSRPFLRLIADEVVVELYTTGSAKIIVDAEDSQRGMALLTEEVKAFLFEFFSQLKIQVEILHLYNEALSRKNTCGIQISLSL